MSEQIAETAPETGTVEATATTETQPAAEQPKPTETVEFWKQKAREQEQRAKSNADKAKDYDALQESQKTEQQKIADRATAAERERDEAKADGLRYKAAAKHAIGEDYFDLLGSGDEETISSRAERVGGLLKENADMKVELEALRAGKPVPATTRPVAELKPGATAEAITPANDDSYPSHWLPNKPAAN